MIWVPFLISRRITGRLVTSGAGQYPVVICAIEMNVNMANFVSVIWNVKITLLLEVIIAFDEGELNTNPAKKNLDLFVSFFLSFKQEINEWSKPISAYNESLNIQSVTETTML